MLDLHKITAWKVSIRNFFWSVFSRIRTEYGDLLRKPPYSVRTLENADQKISVFAQFLRSECVKL